MILTLFLAAMVFPAGTEPMKFTTLERGEHSQIDVPRTVAIRTAEGWAALWRQHAGNTKPPSVDFKTSMLIAVFAGSRPTAGHTVEISRIEKEDAGLVVTYRERVPGADEMVAQVLTAPFHIVQTDAHDGRVTFGRTR